jgi:uncharacterized membrane protein
VTGSLTAVFLAVAAFVGGHFLLSWIPLRSALVARLGEGRFAAAYSILMVLALVWVVAAYRAAPPHVLWDLGRWAKVVALMVMPFALVLLVLGVVGRNPTGVAGDATFKQHAAPVHGAATITRHPFLSGAALLAIAHLLANGDAASVILFGGIGILAVGGMAAIDHKRAFKLGESWKPFSAQTSRIPFGAVMAGRVKVDWTGIGWARPAIGVALYVVLLFTHRWLFGVAVLPV